MSDLIGVNKKGASPKWPQGENLNQISFPVMLSPRGEFIAIQSVPSLFNISVRTVYRLKDKGLLDIYKMSGRKSFVRRVELENLFEKI